MVPRKRRFGCYEVYCQSDLWREISRAPLANYACGVLVELRQLAPSACLSHGLNIRCEIIKPFGYPKSQLRRSICDSAYGVAADVGLVPNVWNLLGLVFALGFCCAVNCLTIIRRHLEIFLGRLRSRSLICG